MAVEIPLSKTGKHTGKYVTIVDDIDADLAELNWSIGLSSKVKYARRLRDGKIDFIHRVIMERMIAPKNLQKGQLVDHINGNGLDNRRENLRIATNSQNLANRKANSNNSTGFKGVTYSKQMKKYHAQIKHNYHRYSLGLFDTPEAAHEAYCAKAKELFGDFAND